MRRQSQFRRVWFTPILLAGLTAAGLTSALLGDQVWDLLSWIILALPIAIALWLLSGGRRST